MSVLCGRGGVCIVARFVVFVFVMVCAQGKWMYWIIISKFRIENSRGQEKERESKRQFNQPVCVSRSVFYVFCIFVAFISMCVEVCCLLII